VPSPSTWWSESPFRPSRTLHGPPAATQQPPAFRHSLSEPVEVAYRVASTVISCAAVPVELNLPARLEGQPAAVAGPPEAVAASTATTTAHTYATAALTEG
jgi:hypothetical protein